MKKELFICECQSAEHQIIFSYCEEDNIVYIQPHLITHKGFFKRLLHGLKYAFGYKCRFGAWDEVIFDADNIIKFHQFLNEQEAKLRGIKKQTNVNPDIISNWLAGQVSFIKTLLDGSKTTANENLQQHSDFILALDNFTYCQKLYEELQSKPDSRDLKRRFKNIILKCIFDSVHELDKQEYRCIYVHDTCWPSKEKVLLPQEVSDGIQKRRAELEDIYNQVQQVCGSGF